MAHNPNSPDLDIAFGDQPAPQINVHFEETDHWEPCATHAEDTSAAPEVPEPASAPAPARQAAGLPVPLHPEVREMLVRARQALDRAIADDVVALEGTGVRAQRSAVFGDVQRSAVFSRRGRR